MNELRTTLIASVTKSISDFNIKYMDGRQNGDAECEKLFTESKMEKLREGNYLDENVDKIKKQLTQKNVEVINALSDKDILFYQHLLEKIREQPIFTIQDSEYLDYCEIQEFLFDMEGELVFWGSV